MARRQSTQHHMIGIDVGGTFTDFVLLNAAGRLVIEKVPTIPADIVESILLGLERTEESVALEKPQLQSLDRLVHGSTVASNAFLERKGARLGFITTWGFRDTLVMHRMFRENMYDTRAPEPVPLVTRDNIFEVRGRIDHEGEIIEPVNEEDVLKAAEEFDRRNVESVGICLLFSFRNPAHELRVKDILKECLPDVHVSASCEVCPEIREYERACTTQLNAYLQPPVAQYLRTLDAALQERRASASLQVMQSYGGVTGASEAAAKPVNMLLSGPAGGVIGSAYWGKLTGYPNIISFDMGGTSCDISLIREGTPALSTPITATSTRRKFEGWDILIPFIDIHTIGSGGGSVAWLDDGESLHVGPQSMGADPGPACYDKGGIEATVTDANVVLGYINPDYYLGGQIQVSSANAREAIGRVAKRLDYSITEAADGIFRIINASMINGIRVVSVEQGHDPRDFALFSFGGAAGVHTTALIDEIGIDRVVIPQSASTFSAFGLLFTDLRHDYVTTIAKPLSEVEISSVHDAFRRMEKQGRKELGKKRGKPAKIWFEYAADMRYLIQSHDIRVPLSAPVRSIKQIIESFNQTYHQAYGYLLEEHQIQLVSLRVLVCMGTAKPEILPEEKTATLARRARKEIRNVYFSEEKASIPTNIYDGHGLRPGNRLKGPAVVELSTTTVVVRPGQVLRVDPYRNFIVARRGVRP